MNQKTFGFVCYGIVALMKYGRSAEPVVGALALGFHHGLPQLPEPEVLRAIAAHLGHDVSS
jgi:hypothetical protein